MLNLFKIDIFCFDSFRAVVAEFEKTIAQLQSKAQLKYICIHCFEYHAYSYPELFSLHDTRN